MPIVCATDSAPRPADAPKLTVGAWTRIDASPSYLANGITIDPCNTSVLYTAGGTYPSANQHGVWRSTNGGASWTMLVSLDSPARVKVDPKDSKNMYVVDGVNGMTQGLWRTKDGGMTWEIPDGFKTTADSPDLKLRDAYSVDADPLDFRHLLVTFHNPWAAYNGASGVLESMDGGDHWIVHPPEATWAYAYGYDIFFLSNPALGLGNGQTWLLGSQGKGYWRTTDSGAHWTQVSDANMTHGGAQIYYTKKGVLYVSSDVDLIKSTNNGETFTHIPFSPVSGYAHLLSIFGDGTRLYAGGSGGPIFSALETDDTTWTAVNVQTFTAQPYQMAFDSKNKILYSANATGGLWALQQ